MAYASAHETLDRVHTDYEPPQRPVTLAAVNNAEAAPGKAAPKRTHKLYKDDVHSEYANALLQMLEQQGISREQALAGTGIVDAQLEEHARLTTHQDALLLTNAVRLTRDPGIGYRIGLHSTLTWHGMLGYGLMSCSTLREALALWAEFLDLRTTTFSLQLSERNGYAELHIHDLAPKAPMRFAAVDRMVTMTTRLCEQLTQSLLPNMEIWHKDGEPLHFARYRNRLVATRFGTGLCQIRIPLADLDRPLVNANASTYKHIRSQCERERARLRRSDDLVVRVMDLLQQRENGDYPSIEQAASHLCMSSRTLKRKLQRLGLNFRGLVDDARKEAVLREVLNPSLRFDEIAVRMGYSDPANLTRAFRRWTGESPSRYRARVLAGQ